MDYTQLSVAERLKIAIRSSGKKQKHIAKEVGIHQDTLSRIVRGEVEGGFEKIAAIAQALDLNVHWLATGHGEMLLSHVTVQEKGLISNTSVGNRSITVTGDGNRVKSKEKIYKGGHFFPIKPEEEKERIKRRNEMINKFEELNGADQEVIFNLVDSLFQKIISNRPQKPE